jgi:hypothetical protein
VAAPGSSGRAGTSQAAEQEPGSGHCAPPTPCPANAGVPQPSWPSSPAGSEPRRPAPDAAQRADSTQPPARPAAATPREPREHTRTATDGPGATAEPADSDPPARWPAPNPRAGDAEPPGQQAGHEMTARQDPGAATETGPRSNTSPERSAAPSADWRDQVLSGARQPWQPAPGWPRNPALHRPPEAGTHGAGIELGEPHA